MPLSGRKGSIQSIDIASLCIPEDKEVNTSKRLESLRKVMTEYELAVYVIPSEDKHQSEYVAPSDQRRSFISGFQGSAGIAVVSRDIMCMNEQPEGAAALSTDARYFSQATSELDFNWVLLRRGVKNEPSWMEWAAMQAIKQAKDSGSVAHIGIDPKLITFKAFQHFESVIREQVAKLPSDSKVEIKLVPISDNLVDRIWLQFEDKPSTGTNSPVHLLELPFLGQEANEKLDKIKSVLNDKGCSGLVVSALDEIAWLLNLRGNDIECNPVFYSYFIVTSESLTLYANSDRFSPRVLEYLHTNHVGIEPYDKFWSDLKSVTESFQQNKKKMLLPKNVSWEIVRNINGTFEQSSSSPIEDLKAVKNATELEGAVKAHKKDGIALCRFFSWLENELAVKDNLIDEVSADEKLTDLRLKQDDFVGLSFPTISATGSNAAIIHYKPIRETCSVVDPSKLYLNDSGSQFVDATTDITRTVHFGTPNSEEIKHYTLVLKGLVALSRLNFPENTSATGLDAVARQFLWAHSLDYPHGTSHGVGAYLNVHEGPISLGPKSECTLAPGNILSNEPGFYVDGSYGIRIENVMYVKDSGYSRSGKPFLLFETITRVPFCKRLIDITLLSSEEKAWINNYHSAVWKDISPSLATKSSEISWLKRETSPL